VVREGTRHLMASIQIEALRLHFEKTILSELSILARLS
jgi:hypothetical protein